MAIWDLQASSGAAGQSILWRGSWSSAISYNPYDAVYSGGSSYISKTNNQNKIPVSNLSDWDLMASVGGAGPQGDLGGLPVGTIVDYGGLTEPDGWLFCWGQTIPRTGIYAPLFGVLGEQFGSGDGVTTFQLPDARGRVIAGREDMGGTAANRLQGVQSCSTTNGSTTLTVEDVYRTAIGEFISGPGIPVGTIITTYISVTSLTMSNTATATASGIPMRFSPAQDPQVLGSAGGTIIHQLRLNEMPVHLHGQPTHQHTTPYPFTAAAGIASGAQYNQGSAQATSQSGGDNTYNAGGDWAHFNTQPTYVCNKIIKYTLPGTTANLTPGTGDVSGPTVSTDGELAVFSGTSGKFIRRGGSLPGGFRLPRGFLGGYRTNNNASDQVNDIDIQDGECRDSTNTVDITLPSSMTKRIDASWAAGTAVGGLDGTGALANLSYHVFVIKNQNTGQVDCLFSPSATAPMLPTGFTHKRRISSFLRTAGVIEGYQQEGDYFFRDHPERDLDGYNVPLTAAGTLATLIRVPAGIKGQVIFDSLNNTSTTAGGLWVSSPYVSGTGASPFGPYMNIVNQYESTSYRVMFNTIPQIRVHTSIASGVVTLWMTVFGWIDGRGRND